MVWVLFMVIASPGAFSGSWGTPVQVGEYPTLDACKAAVSSAVAVNGKGTDTWLQFKDGAVCISRPKS